MSTRKSIAVLIAYGVAGLIAAGLIALVIHRLFFLPAENAERKARGVVQEETISATGKATSEGMEIVREVHIEHRRIDEISRSNEHAIKAAQGADNDASAVAAALRRGLCHYRTYQREPGCAAVLGADKSLGPAGSDDGRPDAR